MSRSLVLTLLAAVELALVAAPTSSASAQACTDTNPPLAADAGPPIECVKAVCPGPADDDDHYDGASIVYFPEKPINQGPCMPGAPNVFPNGCAELRASCGLVVDGVEHCYVQYAGLMYRPEGGPAKAPAVLLVPGSSGCTEIGTEIDKQCIRQPEHFCGLKSALLAQGYVVFEVLPRGYRTDLTHGSSGWYMEDAEKLQKEENRPCSTTGIKGSCGTDDLELEGEQDVTDAYKYLASRSFVNPAAIGVIGHSLGGIRALASNRNNHGQDATIIIAAAAESWCTNGTADTSLRAETLQSVDLAKSAMYFFDTDNDVSIDASRQLSHEAAENDFQYQSAIFPPAEADGASRPLAGDEAHRCFISNQTYIDMYVPGVLDFLRRYGVK